MKTLAHLLAVAAIAPLSAAALPASISAAPVLLPKSALDCTVLVDEKVIWSEANALSTQRSAPPVPYYTEYFVVNCTSKPIQVGLSQSTRGLQKASDVHEVARRDTLRGGDFIDEDEFGGYAQRIHFQLTARKPKWMKGVSIDMEHPAIVQIDATHRRCYFSITKAKKPIY
jgi:hypothetical protein